MVEVLLKRAKQTMTESLIKDWVNYKTDDDGFAALHFASFRGNITIINLLLKSGADLNQKNNYGINVMHVAA